MKNKVCNQSDAYCWIRNWDFHFHLITQVLHFQFQMSAPMGLTMRFNCFKCKCPALIQRCVLWIRQLCVEHRNQAKTSKINCVWGSVQFSSVSYNSNIALNGNKCANDVPNEYNTKWHMKAKRKKKHTQNRHTETRIMKVFWGYKHHCVVCCSSGFETCGQHASYIVSLIFFFLFCSPNCYRYQSTFHCTHSNRLIF